MAQQGARRDLVKERFWRRLVRLWRGSGWTVRDFCAEHGVSEASFFSWRRTLAERDQQRAGRRGRPNATANGDGKAGVLALDAEAAAPDGRPAFVPVRVVATTMTFEVVLHSGRVVRVPAGFEAASLRQLLAVLEERPC